MNVHFSLFHINDELKVNITDSNRFAADMVHEAMKNIFAFKVDKSQTFVVISFSS